MSVAKLICSAFAVSVVVLLFPASADAHLLPPDAATLNVGDRAIFAVVSVPVSALHGFDDDGDGRLSARELDAHREALAQDIAQRFQLSDGDQRTDLVRLDLLLSPEHDAVQDRADHVLALEHLAVSARPSTLRLRTDLFGGPHPHLTVTASRNKVAATAETAELGPNAPEHVFHMEGPPPPITASRRFGGTGMAGVLAMAVASLAAVVFRQRRR